MFDGAEMADANARRNPTRWPIGDLRSWPLNSPNCSTQRCVSGFWPALSRYPPELIAQVAVLFPHHPKRSSVSAPFNQ